MKKTLITCFIFAIALSCKQKTVLVSNLKESPDYSKYCNYVIENKRFSLVYNSNDSTYAIQVMGIHGGKKFLAYFDKRFKIIVNYWYTPERFKDSCEAKKFYCDYLYQQNKDSIDLDYKPISVTKK